MKRFQSPCTRISGLQRTQFVDLGFDLNAISDLTELDQRRSGQCCPRCRAMPGEHSGDAEIESVGRFVENGGQILLVGLQWSWEQYRTSEGLNPCTFNPYSNSRERALDQYPMNALGEQFGITYERGTLPVQ